MNEEIKTMGKRAGVVLEVEGRVMYSRKFPSGNVGTFQAVPGMEVYVNDHIKPDENSTVYIRFHIGGMAKICNGTEMVIVGLRAIDFVGSEFDRSIYTAKKMWEVYNNSGYPQSGQFQKAGGLEG